MQHMGRVLNAMRETGNKNLEIAVLATIMVCGMILVVVVFIFKVRKTLSKIWIGKTETKMSRL